MRLVALLAMLLVICSSTPAFREFQEANPDQGNGSQQSSTSADSAMDFLLRSAASDFHAHHVAVVERFRNTHFGHFVTQTGTKQYELCGEFLPRRSKGNAGWMPFVTIKTSSFEQYLGPQALGWCQRSLFVQDRKDDLSLPLQNLLHSTR